MSFAVVTFQPIHLGSLLVQGEQAMVAPLLDDANYVTALMSAGPCFSGILDGRTMICAGLFKQWENRAIAWALIAREGRKLCPIAIHRAVKRFLDDSDYRRIEAAVDVEFPLAHKWVKALGFEYEGRQDKYTPDGRDVLTYARIQ